MVSEEFVLYIQTDEDLEKKTKSEEFYDCEVYALEFVRLNHNNYEFVDYIPGLAERGKNKSFTAYADAYSFKVKKK